MTNHLLTLIFTDALWPLTDLYCHLQTLTRTYWHSLSTYCNLLTLTNTYRHSLTTYWRYWHWLTLIDIYWHLLTFTDSLLTVYWLFTDSYWHLLTCTDTLWQLLTNQDQILDTNSMILAKWPQMDINGYPKYWTNTLNNKRSNSSSA